MSRELTLWRVVAPGRIDGSGVDTVLTKRHSAKDLAAMLNTPIGEF